MYCMNMPRKSLALEYARVFLRPVPQALPVNLTRLGHSSHFLMCSPGISPRARATLNLLIIGVLALSGNS